jgi:uncharacterized protein YegL
MKLQRVQSAILKHGLACIAGAWTLFGTVLPTMAAVDQVVVVVLDDSGSMRQRMRTDHGTQQRIEVAKEALSRVVSQLSANSQLGILMLNQNQRSNRWLIPLGPLDTKQTLNRIQQIRADGGTPLGASIKSAADALLEARQRKVYGDFRLLIVTDGEASDPDLLADFLPDVLSRGITIDVIGVDMSANHSLANQAHSYRRADDAASLEKALREVFAESSSSNALMGDDRDGISILQGLPDDDDFTREILTALASPSNTEIHGIVTLAEQPMEPTQPSSNVPINPSGSGNSALDGLIGTLAMIPCCMSILIVFIVVVVIFRSKSKRRSR